MKNRAHVQTPYFDKASEKGNAARMMASAPLTNNTPATADPIAGEVTADATTGDPASDEPAAEVTAEKPAADGYAIEPGEKGNPYDELFERIIFTPADTTTVYTNKQQQASKRVANAMIVLRGGFASVPGSVYARKPHGGKQVVEVTIFGNQNQSAIKPHDQQSVAWLLDWRRRATIRYIEWLKANPVTTTVARQQATVPTDGIADLF